MQYLERTPSKRFPCLSIREPWAEILLEGHPLVRINGVAGVPRPYEVRKWGPEDRFVGRDMAIHAGRQLDVFGLTRFGIDFEEFLNRENFEKGRVTRTTAALGAVVGIAYLKGYQRFDQSSTEDQIFWEAIKPWTLEQGGIPFEETYVWSFRKPRVLKEPIFVSGRPDIFRVDIPLDVIPVT